MKSRRISIALLVLAGGCTSSATEPLAPSDDPRALIDSVWRDFDRWYAFFPMREIDWTAVGHAYADSASLVRPGEPTARLIGRMIGTLNDGHVTLYTDYGTFGSPSFDGEHHFDPGLVARNYLITEMRYSSSRNIAWSRLRDSVGYVVIASFAGQGWGAEIEQALADLASVSGVIIDIRDNGGGEEDIAREVASRFADVERTYRFARFRSGPAHTDFGPAIPFQLAPAGVVRFAGTVAVLTNRFNMSAAEDFVLMMRSLPHAFTVGDTTRGVGSSPVMRFLPNGWKYRLPRSQQSTPEGFVYNWKGLAPSLAVAWSAVDVAQGRDPYLETALEEIRRRQR